jgi:hypothetical protein
MSENTNTNNETTTEETANTEAKVVETKIKPRQIPLKESTRPANRHFAQLFLESVQGKKELTVEDLVILQYLWHSAAKKAEASDKLNDLTIAGAVAHILGLMPSSPVKPTLPETPEAKHLEIQVNKWAIERWKLAEAEAEALAEVKAAAANAKASKKSSAKKK